MARCWVCVTKKLWVGICSVCFAVTFTSLDTLCMINSRTCEFSKLFPTVEVNLTQWQDFPANQQHKDTKSDSESARHLHTWPVMGQIHIHCTFVPVTGLQEMMINVCSTSNIPKLCLTRQHNVSCEQKSQCETYHQIILKAYFNIGCKEGC